MAFLVRLVTYVSKPKSISPSALDEAKFFLGSKRQRIASEARNVCRFVTKCRLLNAGVLCRRSKYRRWSRNNLAGRPGLMLQLINGGGIDCVLPSEQ